MKKYSVKEKKKRAEIVVRELKRLFPEAETILKYGNPWEMLVAVMLSAQTTDVQVNKVTNTLFKKYKTLDDYVHADPVMFEQDLSSIGLYRAKAKNVLASAKKIKEEFGGALPNTMEEMIALPGVGRKTANVVLGSVYGVVDGIAVDTHVQRLARLFGLTNEITPEKIEKDLMEILPRKEWYGFTFRMIDYGRKYCPARCKHGSCPILTQLHSPLQ